MISLMFNQTFWLIVLAVVLLIIAVVICTKYEIARYIVFGIVCVGLLISSVFAGHYLNTYYSASGGIFGYIDGIVVKNELTKENEASFKLNNLNFSATSNDNEFIAVFKTNETLVELDKNANYKVSINGNDCFIDLIGSDYINGRFVYAFYSRNNTLMFTDALKFNISCYNNFTQLQLFTTGGSEAVKYWNSYFTKNGIVFNIEKAENEEKTVPVLEEVEATSDYVLVSLYDDKGECLNKFYKIGETVILPSYSDLFFNNYSVKVNGSFSRCKDSYVITSKYNVVLKPKFDRIPSDNELIAEMISRQGNTKTLDLTQLGSLTSIPSNSIVNKNYENIILPSSCVKIESNAIVGCKYLGTNSNNKFSISDDVKIIEENAFVNCSSSMLINVSFACKILCPDTYDTSFFNNNIDYDFSSFLGQFKTEDGMLIILFNCKDKQFDLPYRTANAKYDYTYAQVVNNGGFNPYSAKQDEFSYSYDGKQDILTITNLTNVNSDFTSISFSFSKVDNTLCLTSSDGSIVLKLVSSSDTPVLEPELPSKDI